MKRTFLLFLVFAVLFQATVNSSRCRAQEITLPIPLSNKQKLLMSTIMGPAMNSFFTKHRPGMIGLSFAMNPMFKSGFESEFGFTEDQSALVMEKLIEKFKDREDMVAFGQLLQQIDERAGQDENAEFLELSEEELATIQQGYDLVFDRFSEIAPEVFTPEQMEKIKEMEFATFGGIESPFLNVEAMSVLDLTDEQKREIEELQQDIADEKLEMIDGLTEFTTKIFKSGKLNMKEAQEFDAKNKTLTNKIGTRLREILTEEQLKKATKLVKTQQAKMLKMMGGLGAISQWMPNADSWVPGMPIPDSLQSQEPQRKAAFPRAKKPKPVEVEPVIENEDLETE